MKPLDTVLSLLNSFHVEKCKNCEYCCRNYSGLNCPGSYHDNMEDYYNHTQSRNFSNIPLTKYNCGGFALNTYNWFIPDYNVMNLSEYRNIVMRAAWNMVDKFKGDLRIVYNLNEVYNDEYAIMFRFEMSDKSNDIAKRLCDGCPNVEFDCNECNALDDEDLNWYLGDFHFIREFNGQWIDKPGSCRIKEINTTDLFRTWNERYEGKIVMMAMKKTRDLLLTI